MAFEPVENSKPAVFGTFGIYRYCLATIVMLSHVLPGAWEVIGEYAVFGFFILSGYVVSYILHYSYLPLERGIRKYAVNRMLRIYPAFWMVSLAVLAILFIFYPDPASRAHSLVDYPRGIAASRLAYWLLLNLSSMGSLIHGGYLLNPSLIPNCWSLGVEICYWALMPLMLISRPARILFLLFGVGYTLAMIAISFDPPHNILILRYFSPLAGALPFGIGLWLFIWNRKGHKPLPHAIGITAILLLIALVACCHSLADPYFAGLYLSLGLNAIIVAYLSRFDQRSISAGLQRIDSFCGYMAYPIFLVHVPAALLLQALFPLLPSEHPFAFVCFALLLSNLIALLLHRGVEAPINRVRRKVKSRGLATGPR